MRARDECEHGEPRRGSHASAPNPRQRGRHGRDTLHDTVEVRHDVTLSDAQDTPTERRERAVPRSIVMLTLVMRAAVDLDDETHLGAREVDDVIADDELT